MYYYQNQSNYFIVDECWTMLCLNSVVLRNPFTHEIRVLTQMQFETLHRRVFGYDQLITQITGR